MKKFKISNDEVAELSNAPHYEFPKYVTQFINLVISVPLKSGPVKY